MRIRLNFLHFTLPGRSRFTIVLLRSGESAPSVAVFSVAKGLFLALPPNRLLGNARQGVFLPAGSELRFLVAIRDAVSVAARFKTVLGLFDSAIWIDATLQRALENLKAGDVAVVDRIATANGASKRLADMGFIRGARLEMVRPGAPCIVRLNSLCVGLGLAYQTSILVGPV